MKKMKEFVSRNFVITIICIVALLICISYCVIYRISDVGWIDRWYSFFNSVSVSYIAAFLFYIFQVYIPQVRGEELAKEAIRRDMEDIDRLLCLTVACLMKYVEYNDDGGTIIKWDEPYPIKKIFFKYGSANGKCTQLQSMTEAEIFGLNNHFKEKIARVKNSNHANFFSKEIIRLLDDLEDVKIFENVNIILRFADSIVNIQSMKKIEIEIQPIVEKIHTIFSINTTWVIEETDELEKMAADFPRDFKKYKNIDDFNNKAIERILESGLDK